MNLASARGYCDLNLPVDCDAATPLDLVKRCLSLGYETLALNIRVHQKELISKSKHQSKKAKLDEKAVEKTMLDFPEPPTLKLEPSDYPELAAKGRSPIILFRLTITFFNNDFLPFVANSVTIKKYDLLAISPESTLALQNLLKSSFKADILCFDPERVKDVLWSRKLYMECVNREMMFEIPYSPCIRDSTLRRRIIAQAHTYHAVGKSKAIIFSSEALTPLELRGPHDVANLAFIFGLKEHQGKEAVKQNPILVVQNASGRKLGPYRALIQPLDQLPEEDRWKIPDQADAEPPGEGSSSSSESE